MSSPNQTPAAEASAADPAIAAQHLGDLMLAEVERSPEEIAARKREWTALQARLDAELATKKFLAHPTHWTALAGDHPSWTEPFARTDSSA